MNIEEALAFCNNQKHNCNILKKDNIIENKNGSYSFNSSLKLVGKIEELPFKIDTVDGEFDCSNIGLNSFKNFPRIINGDLRAYSNNFESWDEWDIKEINGIINLCSENSKLKDLDLLVGTKFKTILLKVTNSMFLNNKIPNEYYKYCKDGYEKLSLETFEKMIEEGVISPSEDSIDCYLDLILTSDLNSQMELKI